MPSTSSLERLSYPWYRAESSIILSSPCLAIPLSVVPGDSIPIAFSRSGIVFQESFRNAPSGTAVEAWTVAQIESFGLGHCGKIS